MPPTSWTDRRLQSLFERYRLRYWPTSRRLGRYEIAFATLDALGQCFYEPPLIKVDLKRHPSDRELRATVLHEMCHVVAGPKSKGHDSLFFAQLEYLLQECAPITVGFPENPDGQSNESVPAQFKRCRRLLKPLYERQRRAFEYRLARRDHKVRTVTTEEIADRFYQAAYEEDMTWREALVAVGTEFGFLDIDRRPMPFAEKFLPDLRRAHSKGRASARDEKANRRLQELTSDQWDSLSELSREEAAKRVGVPVSILQSYLSVLYRRDRLEIPPVSRSSSGSTKR